MEPHKETGRTAGIAKGIRDRYEIAEPLGRGGAGEVYCAWDRELARTVAVKFIRGHDVSQGAVQEAKREAVRLAAIRHPGIVAVYDLGFDGETPYIVMEHVVGETLEDRVNRAPMGDTEFGVFARQTLEALAAAHSAGLIHLDLKPTNLMLAPQPSGAFQVKVLDFGISRFLSAPPDRTATLDGTVLGSIQCISPEQLCGQPADVRSDLYSLGCAFYQGLTGIAPFGGHSTDEIISAHLEHRLVPLEALRPDLPPILCQWVMALLNRQPQDRYQTALEALDAVNGILATSPLPHAPAGPLRIGPTPAASPAAGPAASTGPIASAPEPRTHLMTVVASTLAALLICVGTAWFLTERLRPSRDAGTELASASQPLAHASLPPAAPEEPSASASPGPGLASPAPQPEPTAPPSPAAAPVAANPGAPRLLSLRGSNTLGASLAPELVRAYFQKLGAESLRDLKGQVAEELQIVGALEGSAFAVDIAAHGTGTAFTELAAGRTEIGMASRTALDKEVAACAEVGLGDLRSPANEHVIGLDGLAVFVHPANPVQSLTVQQIAAIFSGAITDWSEVGGVAGPIRLHARDDKSGTYDTFKSLVLGKERLRADAARYEDSNALSDAVGADPGAIGFAGLPYVRETRALAIAAGPGAAPLLPTPFTVATEDYALSRRLYLYTAANPSNPHVRRFLEFVQSPEGQDVVQRVGFIRQAIETQRPRTPADAPPEYLAATRDAERLSVNFRFRPGSADLDTKALRDLDRLTRFLAGSAGKGRELLLLGFSDSSGSADANRVLSRERAATVAAALATRGVTAERVAGFGSALPLAANDTEAGRQRNRRVEVWVR